MILLFEFINTYILGPGLCTAVLGCGVFFAIILKGFFVFKPRRMLAALKSTPSSGVSPARAMCVALAGTLGVGNIAGVASAVAIGGAGSVFWMLASGVLAMPIKYAEVVLAIRHRRIGKDGIPHGGAYFYIADRKTRAGLIFASVFAVLCLACSVTVGTAMQSSAIAVSASTAFGIKPAFIGTLLAVAVFAVARGGLSRISFVTSKLVPAMSVIYILMSLFIILTNTKMLPSVVGEIMTEAFKPSAAFGGVMGFFMGRAVRMGVTRGILSNEAGCGTAPIAHASAECRSAATQGVWGMAEVFIDTVVICTLTALSVLIGERHGIRLSADGMRCASAVYARFIPLADVILCIAVTVFAFCTIVCWYYYGSESLSYLTKNSRAGRLYLLMYTVSVLLGAVLPTEGIWEMCDTVISLMTAVNTAVLLIYSREIKAETDREFFK